MARRNAIAIAAFALWAGFALPAPALAAPQVSGTWRQDGAERAFVLTGPAPDGASGRVVPPGGGPLHRVTLRGSEGSWQLVVERERPSEGLVGRLTRQAQGAPLEPQAPTPPPSECVALRRVSDALLASADGAWRLAVDGPTRASVAAVASAARPRVTVLLTGFDRFPLLLNHPRWISANTPKARREPRINPSGWAVRAFELERLAPELRERVEVVVHRRLDLPVEYHQAAQIVTDAIAALQPDVVIAFGLGADGGLADVERTCENLREDGFAYGQEDAGPGPFTLPPGWPPAGPRDAWSAADRAWLWRYPDNAGVSYSGAPIEPDGPATRGATLPVDRIVARLEQEGLRAIDGGDGPGRYICNNVMYSLLGAQNARGGLGGFIHLASWSESRSEDFLQVVACAVEESVEAWLELERAPEQRAVVQAELSPP